MYVAGSSSVEKSRGGGTWWFTNIIHMISSVCLPVCTAVTLCGGKPCARFVSFRLVDWWVRLFVDWWRFTLHDRGVPFSCVRFFLSRFANIRFFFSGCGPRCFSLTSRMKAATVSGASFSGKSGFARAFVVLLYRRVTHERFIVFPRTKTTTVRDVWFVSF